jgi:hypothetical protein
VSLPLAFMLLAQAPEQPLPEKPLPTAHKIGQALADTAFREGPQEKRTRRNQKEAIIRGLQCAFVPLPPQKEGFSLVGPAVAAAQCSYDYIWIPAKYGKNDYWGPRQKNPRVLSEKEQRRLERKTWQSETRIFYVTERSPCSMMSAMPPGELDCGDYWVTVHQQEEDTISLSATPQNPEAETRPSDARIQLLLTNWLTNISSTGIYFQDVIIRNSSCKPTAEIESDKEVAPDNLVGGIEKVVICSYDQTYLPVIEPKSKMSPAPASDPYLTDAKPRQLTAEEMRNMNEARWHPDSRRFVLFYHNSCQNMSRTPKPGECIIHYEWRAALPDWLLSSRKAA